MKKPFLIGAAALAALWLAAHLWPEKPYAPRVLPEAYLEAAAEWRAQYFTALPEGWVWREHIASDGASLRWGMAEPAETPVATVLFVPGFNGYQEVYAENYHALLARGYRVIGLDQRGHGGSARMLDNPEKHWVRDFSVYTDDLAGFVEAVREESDGPLILMGESFGGHVSLRMTGDHQPAVDGLVLIVPALRVHAGGIPPWLARGMVDVSRALGFSKSYAVGQGDWQPWEPDLTKANPCGTDPTRVHTKDVHVAAYPEYRGGGPTNQWLGEIMQSGDRVTRKAYLEEIALPVVLATADEDYIVRSAPAEKACKQGLPNCTHILLEDTRHCISYERPEVREQIFDALDEMMAGL